jgi:hypothetical protein
LLVWGNALLVLNHIKQYVRKSVVLELYSCMHWALRSVSAKKKGHDKLNRKNITQAWTMVL